jgi:hypothetical protein
MLSAVATQERAAVTKFCFWLGSSSLKANAKQSAAKWRKLFVVTMTASMQARKSWCRSDLGTMLRCTLIKIAQFSQHNQLGTFAPCKLGEWGRVELAMDV